MEQNLQTKTIGLSFVIVGSLLLILTFLFKNSLYTYSVEYYTHWIVWVTISFGSMLLLVAQNVSHAKWSLGIHPVIANNTSGIVGCVVLALPILCMSHTVFRTVFDAAHHKPYLNPVFFITRMFFYLLLWVAYSVTSIRKTKHSPLNTHCKRQPIWAIVLVLTGTFAGIDWLMALSPHWQSAIFGLYILASSFLAALCFNTVTLTLLGRKTPQQEWKTAAYSNLGQMIFGFTCFWAYTFFCQFLLIWYANLPFETQWFHARQYGQWKNVSIALFVGHFVVPFFSMLSWQGKRNPTRVTLIALWLLFMHGLNMYWIVAPHFFAQPLISWVGICVGLGIESVLVGVILTHYHNTNIKTFPLTHERIKHGT